MNTPIDPEGAGTPRGESRAPLRLAGAVEVHETSGDSYSSDLAQMIQALRARIDEEFRIMERLDVKGRQAFTLVAAFFAVVQTVASGAFGDTGVGGAASVVLAVLAIVAGLLVLLAGHRLREAEALRLERDLNPDKILGWWQDATEENAVSLKLVTGLAEVAKTRYANNRDKAALYKKLDDVVRITLILTSVELVWAILIRA